LENKPFTSSFWRQNRTIPHHLESVLEKLRTLYQGGKIEPYNSPFSLLEALGKISKTPFDEERLNGLVSIVESKVFLEALPHSAAT